MHFEYSYVLEDGLEILAAIISGLPATLFQIGAYVLTALALYTLAQRRGIRHGWLAWIPVLNAWVLGSLSDQYRYLVKGEFRSKRKSLLVMNIVNSALVLVAVILIIVAVVLLGTSGFFFTGFYPQMPQDQLIGLGIALACISLAIVGFSIAITVVRFIALYDIYRSMDPDNGTVFLVLSILFPVTEPFFLFFNRNKELGMPPRRDMPPVEEPVWQQPREPWEAEEKDCL